MPGCPVLVQSGRCAKHRQAYEKARGTAEQRGYDAAWAKFSRVWRQQHPLCGERADGQLYPEHSACARDGITSPAGATDHIRSMANGGEKYDEKNLQSLCVRCNAAKRNQVDRLGKRS
jgi:5-methylcytosine-specific restriction endonuclease McrA